METVKNLFAIFIPSLALSIAMYTFLSNNPKFREFSKSLWIVVFLQIFSVICCSLLLFIVYITDNRLLCNNHLIENIHKVIYLLGLVSYISGWFCLIRLFYKIYGSLYHLRNKRFLKYTKLINIIYDKFFHNQYYEENYQTRHNIKLSNYLDETMQSKIIEKVKNGGSILVLFEAYEDIEKISLDFVLSAIESKETVDYIVTTKPPTSICELISDENIRDVTKKLSIIDSFSYHYSFDDKVLKHRKVRFAKKGFKFYDASSFSDIHSSANSSWYRFRETCAQEENEYRIPHRSIYNNLSSLIDFSSVEQYYLFITHVLNSEKSYGMITVFFEPKYLNKDVLSRLETISDVVLDRTNDNFDILKI